MRVLGRLRISRATDESTSIERQRDEITRWAEANGHELVGWAEDQDVSGSVDQFDTPGLGPWLKDRHPEWDILVAWKLDRLGRNAIKLNALFGWCIEHSKTVVSTSEAIDLGTPVGRLIANVIAFLAEGELEAIRDRTIASHRKLRETGRWGGGVAYYGYVPKARDAAGWELDIDPHAAGVLHEIIDKTLAGRPTESIVIELNDRGELSPADYLRKRGGKAVRGTKWGTSTVRHMLRSKTLLGHMTHNGETVYGDDGTPILKGPPLLTGDKFGRLQVFLDGTAIKRTARTKGASPLLGIAVCDVCGESLYMRQYASRKPGVTLRQYVCKHGPYSKNGEPYNIIAAEVLETFVKEQFLDRMGAKQRTEKVFLPGEDRGNDIEVAERAVEDLTALVGRVTGDRSRERLLGQLEQAHERLDRLEALPRVESRWEVVDTGETYAEAWEKASDEERRQIMLQAGVKVRAQMKGRVPRVSPGVFVAGWFEWHDTEARLAR